MTNRLFTTVPKGMESLLAGELRALGARDLEQTRAGVAFRGSLATAYRVCLWSRLASRVLLPLASSPVASADDLYAAAGSVSWDDHMSVDDTFAVDFTGVNDLLRDTRFSAVRVKDAIADQFRQRFDGRRPSVDVRAPDLRVSAHLGRGRLTLSLDLSGESLHRRGYRRDKVQVEAPLKENLAAAMLVYAEWPRIATSGGSFLDPLCGSGTLPIEAAWMAADVAPGLLRAESGRGFGFFRWRGHDQETWDELLEEARGRRAAGLRSLWTTGAERSIRGSDRDAQAVAVASACVERAGLRGLVRIECAELSAARPLSTHGLVAANAPYGERLGERETADAFYHEIGHVLREHFGGWQAAVLAGRREQIRTLDVTAKRETTLFNGPLPCSLAYLSLEESSMPGPRSHRASVRSAMPHPEDDSPTGPMADMDGLRVRAPKAGTASARPAGLLSSGAEQFANRLRKNRRHLARRLRREDLTCYRLYDADLPEYNLVVDVYGDWVSVQEYAAPTEIHPAKVRQRLEDALTTISAVLAMPSERIVLKERRRQRGAAQYEREGLEGVLQPISEDGLTYLVNLTDYLDTGFFLDQRLTRRMVRKLAGGTRFLNLFAYTGTMTVNALAGGAIASTSVDLSATYLRWAQRNLAANGFEATLELDDASPQSAAAHRLVRADCLRWLSTAEGEHDLIWLDPPTFSNSKRMGRATFDVQRDHADLIRLAARRHLAPGGTLLFATNRRGFEVTLADLRDLDVKDLSRASLPFDCERAANRHHLFQISRPQRRPARRQPEPSAMISNGLNGPQSG